MPGLTKETWPRVEKFPMRHMLTARLPEGFKGPSLKYVGFSLFVHDAYETSRHIKNCKGKSRLVGVKEEQPRFTWSTEDDNYTLACFWHTEASLNMPLCEMPECCDSQDPSHLSELKVGDDVLFYINRSGFKAGVHYLPLERLPISLSRSKNKQLVSDCKKSSFVFGGYPDHLWQWDPDVANRPTLSFHGTYFNLWGEHLLFLDNMQFHWDCD